MVVDPKSLCPPAKILIVEDNRRLLDAISRQLKAGGWRCVSCSNASEAMVQFASGGFDLVITDLTMPDVDGLSVIALIRSQSDLPIIVISGHTEDYAPVLNGYDRITIIRKPFDLKSFAERVQDIIVNSGNTHAR